MTDIWTTTVDEPSQGIVTFTEWNALVGANGNLDYLYNRGWRLHGQDTTERTTTSTSAVDLSTVSSLSIPVEQPILIVGSFRKSAGAAAGMGLGLKINTTTVIEADASSGLATASATNQAENGSFMWLLTPRSANYLCGIVGMSICRVSATGADAVAAAMKPASATFTALIPNATITSIIIRALSGSASVTAAVDEIAVYAGGVTL